MRAAFFWEHYAGFHLLMRQAALFFWPQHHLKGKAVKKMLKLFAVFVGTILAFGASPQSRAQGTSAFAQMTSSPIAGGYHYDITLNNTGSVDIGTFWFGWVPGYDFLPSAPSNIQAPSGWYGYPSGGYPPDGNSIEFYAYAGGLSPGSSLDFGFDSADSPATLAGDSANYPFDPILTAYTYGGTPFSDAGNQFQVLQSVPEPSTLGLLTAGSAGLLLAGWRRRRRPRG
jgi:hypothetical protein